MSSLDVVHSGSPLHEGKLLLLQRDDWYTQDRCIKSLGSADVTSGLAEAVSGDVTTNVAGVPTALFLAFTDTYWCRQLYESSHFVPCLQMLLIWFQGACSLLSCSFVCDLMFCTVSRCCCVSSNPVSNKCMIWNYDGATFVGSIQVRCKRYNQSLCCDQLFRWWW